MKLAEQLTQCAALALLSAFLWYLFPETSILSAFIVFLGSYILQVIAVLVFIAFVYPRISPIKHLPTAPQRPLREQYFKEPNPFLFAKWVNEVPNDGLIRYFGFLNIERVLIASSDAAHQVLQTHTYDFIKPESMSLHLSRFTGKGLAWQEGDSHKIHQRVMNAAMQHKTVKSLYPTIWGKAVELTNVLRQQIDTNQSLQSSDLSEKSSSGVRIDIKDYVDRAMFDIVGVAIHGRDLKATTNPELEYWKYKGFRDAIEPSPSHRKRMVASFALPGWLVNILPLENNRIAAPAMAAFRKLGHDLIATKRSEKVADPEKPEILRAMLEAGGQLSDAELLEEYLTVQTAAIHPTSSAILSTIWFLSQPKYRYVQSKLREEIQKSQPNGNDDRVYEQMPYLQAVLNEVLRLHSVFTHTGRQPIKKTVICGSELPIGLTMSYSPYALHRSTAVWGPDADEFRPERWLSGGPGVDNAEDFHSFGVGKRLCLGRKYAIAEIKCFISQLFGQFDFRFPEEEQLPRITHQVTLAFKDRVRPIVSVVE